jgi:hypothetical protein
MIACACIQPFGLRNRRTMQGQVRKRCGGCLFKSPLSSGDLVYTTPPTTSLFLSFSFLETSHPLTTPHTSPVSSTFLVTLTKRRVGRAERTGGKPRECTSRCPKAGSNLDEFFEISNFSIFFNFGFNKINSTHARNRRTPMCLFHQHSEFYSSFLRV